MDLQPDENQQLLKQAIDRYLAHELPFEARKAQRSGADFVRFWRALEAELGIAAAGAPEKIGGFGGGAEAEAIVAGALGRTLAVTPYVPTMVLAANLLERIGRADVACEIVAGISLTVVALEEPQTRGDVASIATRAQQTPEGWALTGQKLAVEFAAEADRVIIPARLQDDTFALFAVSRAELGASLRPYALIDDTPAADILLDSIPVGRDSLIEQGQDVLLALEATIDRARAALCAEAAALAEVMVADTVAYTKDRKQFGVPLASFQTLQHRMVDMWIASEAVSAAALLAALKVSSPAAVSAAKATCAEALREIGQGAVQLHGAMGMTEELRVGHYFKRATVLEYKLGSADYHVERYRRLRLAA